LKTQWPPAARPRSEFKQARYILDFETIIYFSARDWNFESDGVLEGGNHGSGALDHSDGENFPVASEDFCLLYAMFSPDNLLWRNLYL
jgi:hypothetical protein